MHAVSAAYLSYEGRQDEEALSSIRALTCLQRPILRSSRSPRYCVAGRQLTAS